MLTAIPHRRCRFTEVPIGRSMAADPLDAYMTPSVNALRCRSREAWKPAVRQPRGVAEAGAAGR